MIDLLKEKIKKILEKKPIRLKDGSHGHLYGETISSFLGDFEELIKDEEIKEGIKTEVEKKILKEIKELKLVSDEQNWPPIKEIYFKIRSWQEKLKNHHG